MTQLRLLIADGDTLEGRARNIARLGQTFSDAYAIVLQNLALSHGAEVCARIIYPADPGAALRLGESLEDFDGVALTGSSLHIWKAGPAALRQVDFARAVFASRTPFFGSCWGLQVAAVAAGGSVRQNPKGREVGFARNITLTSEGRASPLHADKPWSFSAPSVHLDEVSALPEGSVITAYNDVSDIQGAVITSGGGEFWGVQYHPEYTLTDVRLMLSAFDDRLIEEGFYGNAESAHAHLSELQELERNPSRRDIAWRLGLGRDILDPAIRLAELSNWIAHCMASRK